MTFRSRLLLAFAGAALLPLLLLALGVRRQLETRLTAQYNRRVDALAAVMRDDVERENASIAARLSAITRRMRDDNRLRPAMLQRESSERAYLLDYAEQAMRLSGLSILQLQDDAGRIISSGHFRNEFDRLEPDVPRVLSTVPNGVALMQMRTPEGGQLALVRVDSVRIGSRRFTIVGGVSVDDAFIRGLARDSDWTISLLTPDSDRARENIAGEPQQQAAVVLSLPYIRHAAAESSPLASAQLLISYSTSELAMLRGDVNRWLLAAVALAVTAAAALGVWLSARLSRPLADLALATGSLNLDGPEVDIAVARNDEIGVVARKLVTTGRRLRANAVKLRDAERLATVGEMARQVNHDIKNGLIPIRNVVRHFAEVQERQPRELPAVFAERRATLESSLTYLDTLARNYARLSPRLDLRVFDANVVLLDVVRAAAGGGAPVHARLQPGALRIVGDPLILRRILDNLLRNAVESLTSGNGRVTVTSARRAGSHVSIAISDTGAGMTAEQLTHAFGDFHTTKDGGIGLGLTVVRRLTSDIHGQLRVESAPGRGTTFLLDLPAANSVAAD